ncbi:anti-sigma B factor antagonist [Krasilnikovia cinnamomea]|uniref:Anti-sigma factor antagonist n=2 Tax=Krasilnikovia cinnamomea TaxID=349313 RepID=A0A4Q7ZEB0_9ACTN|nr:anti-sigma B factor antagonist [Krasilnikovia cinnamomea]
MPDVCPPLHVDVRRTASVTTVVIAGEVDQVTSAEMSKAVAGVLQEDRNSHVVLDLGNVTFLDSSGIRALVICRGDAEQLGIRLEIRPVHDRVRRVLHVCGLEDLFHLPAA